jgi:hypothetical protein
MPRTTTARGRSGRLQGTEGELGDGRGWPQYRATQRALEGLGVEGAEAARQRAQSLLTDGYGALAGWLDAGDDAQPQRQRRGPDRLADLFDAA